MPPVREYYDRRMPSRGGGYYRGGGDYRGNDYRGGDYRGSDYRSGDFRTGDYRSGGDYRSDYHRSGGGYRGGGDYRGTWRPRGGIRGSYRGGYQPSRGGPPGPYPRKRPYTSSATSKRGESAPRRGDHKKELKIPFSCTLCNVSMKTEGDIADHLMKDQHSKSISRLYAEFDKKFKVNQNLARADAEFARAQWEMQKFKGEEPAAAEGDKKKKPFRCAVCAVTVMEPEEEHVKKQTHKELDSMQNVPCNVCKRKFSTRVEFERHLVSFSHYDRLVDPSDAEGVMGFNIEEMSTLDEVGEDDGNEGEDGEGGDWGEGSEAPMAALPSYDPDLPVGLSYVEEYTMAKCLLCEGDEFSGDEVEGHCKSEAHFEKFVEKLQQEHQQQLHHHEESETKMEEGDEAKESHGEEATAEEDKEVNGNKEGEAKEEAAE